MTNILRVLVSIAIIGGLIFFVYDWHGRQLGTAVEYTTQKYESKLADARNQKDALREAMEEWQTRALRNERIRRNAEEREAIATQELKESESKRKELEKEEPEIVKSELYQQLLASFHLCQEAREETTIQLFSLRDDYTNLKHAMEECQLAITQLEEVTAASADVITSQGMYIKKLKTKNTILLVVSGVLTASVVVLAIGGTL
jgi:regulator of replication initiation timing